jgi:hypothetical protein
MNNMELIEKYQQLNEGFHRKLIHHFGTGNGFYSELNSLLFSTLFCLQNKLRLELYSKDATFTFGNGWTEYFEPFCPEFKNDYIGKRISRDYINNHRDKHICYLYKIFTKNDILNDIYWYCRSGWFEHSHFCIPELGIDGDIRQAMKVIIPIVYRFNDKYAAIMDKFIDDLNLPDEYISLHVRAGDKVTERKLITPQDYLEKAKLHSDCHNIFVATDDYRIFEQFRDNNPEYTFYTSTSPEEKGYDQDKFVQSSKEYIQHNLIEMFASIRVFLQSGLFVGTFSSNPGMFVGMQLDERMIGMDFDRWLIL